MKKYILEWIYQVFRLVPRKALLEAQLEARVSQFQTAAILRAIEGRKIISDEFDRYDLSELACETIFICGANVNIQSFQNLNDTKPAFNIISGNVNINIKEHLSNSGNPPIMKFQE